MIPFDSGTITDRDELKLDEYEVNLKQYYYYIDGTINTEYPVIPDYDAYARLTAVSDVTGPVEFSGDEDDLQIRHQAQSDGITILQRKETIILGLRTMIQKISFIVLMEEYQRTIETMVLEDYSSYASGGYGTVDFDLI